VNSEFRSGFATEHRQLLLALVLHHLQDVISHASGSTAPRSRASPYVHSFDPRDYSPRDLREMANVCRRVFLFRDSTRSGVYGSQLGNLILSLSRGEDATSMANRTTASTLKTHLSAAMIVSALSVSYEPGHIMSWMCSFYPNHSSIGNLSNHNFSF